MDLESARVFVAFAEVGCQLTACGRVVGLSQPAVHARLQALARDLDVALYERRGRRLALTAEGTRVLAWAKDAVEAERALRKSLGGDVDDGRVVIACGEGALVHVVAARVAEIARKHPGRLSFRVVDGPTAVELVTRGEAHMAVVAGAVSSSSSSLKAIPVVTTALCAVAPRRHPAVAAARIDVEALLRFQLLVPPPGRPLRTVLEEAALTCGRTVEIAAEVTGWEAVARLAALGVGVGVVNDVVATPGLARSEIVGVAGTTYRLLRRRSRALAHVDEVIDAITVADPAARVRPSR
jgi:DNA-binding transcriptional LysR family regulator